jgi:hydroxyethylthiazole kinase
MLSPNVKAAQDLEKIRENAPLVHNITNFVVMNSTANVLLAAGASPVMAHAENEVEDMVSLAGALVLNIGTLTDVWLRAMVVAGRKANELGVPVVLDPVGAGATGLRTAASQELLGVLDVAVIRANASEVLALAGNAEATKGVDSVHSAEEAAEVMPALAKELNCTIAVTGATDVVTDGEKTLAVTGGHPMMGYVTGTGCAATVVVGAFLAVDKDPVQAAAGGLAFFGLAGARAGEKCPGPGTYWVRILDELYNVTEHDLRSAELISER